MNSSLKHRVFGLDLLRTVAISLVVFEHSKNILPSQISILKKIRLPDGVDLFFVLSGYLIGLIIIRTFEKKKDFNLSISLNFLIRRWFRTFPNYFLFLVVNVLLIYYSLIPGQLNNYFVTYLFFFQNFHKPYDFMFWESWSLAIEEWFYFLFPLIITIFVKFNNPKILKQRKRILLLSILFLVTFSLGYRIIQSSYLLDTDLYFRKLVLTRLDTISFGVLGAYISFYHTLPWVKYKNFLFILGVVIIAALLRIDFYFTFFYQTFYFTLMSLGILLMFPKLSHLKKGGVFTRPIRYFSKISYSIYLVHLPVLYNMKSIVDYNEYSFMLYGLFLGVTILISALIFRFYEKPLTKIREKIHEI